MNKVVIDLDNPIWLEEGGFGIKSTRVFPYCALGKLSQHLGNDHKSAYSFYSKLSDEPSHEIYHLNDKGVVFEDKGKQENHQAALRLMFEKLMESGNVEFKGTKVSEVLGCLVK